MPLKVLHVIPAVASRYGGPSVATVGLCRALRAAGVSTLVATTDADGPGRLDQPLGREVTWEEVPAIFFSRVGSESFKWSPAMASWLEAHAAQFDVVHVHAVLSHVCVAAARASRAANVPYLMRPLGTLDPWSLRQHALRKRVLMRLGASSALRHAAGMHYTSREEQRLSEESVPGLPTGYVVPLGVADDLFVASDHLAADGAGADAEQPYVLTLSRVDAKKGIDVLIRAWHALARSGRLGAWSLRIAGDGDPAYVAEMHALADAGPGADRITFTGWVGGPDRRALLGGAGLFALPSHQENFGFALAEAMASGVAVIVSPGVNLAADIAAADAGWIADRANFDGVLAEALARPATCRLRGRHARVYAEAFRWPRVANELARIYADLAGRREDIPSVGAAATLRAADTGVCS